MTTLVLQPPTISYGDCQVRMHPVVRTRRSVLAIVGLESFEFNRNPAVEEKCFYWHNLSRVPRRDGGEQIALKKQRVSLRGVYMGVSTQQWPSTPITLLQRTRQSAWLDAVTTPVEKKEVNSCASKHLFIIWSSATKKFAQKPWKYSLRRATKVTFRKFRALCGFWKSLFARFYLMNSWID